MTAVLLALAVVAGAPIGVVGVAVLVLIAPVFAVLLLVGFGVAGRLRRRRHGPGPDDEAAYLHGVATELSAGASLRSALGSAPSGGLEIEPVAAAALAGLDADRVAGLLAPGLPVNGRIVAAAWTLASETGGPASGLFQTLALRAAREGELLRERRALTAQARASAWVVAGLPVLLLVATAASGRLDTSDPALAAILITGIGLQAAGVSIVVAMVRRSAR